MPKRAGIVSKGVFEGRKTHAYQNQDLPEVRRSLLPPVSMSDSIDTVDTER